MAGCIVITPTRAWSKQRNRRETVRRGRPKDRNRIEPVVGDDTLVGEDGDDRLDGGGGTDSLERRRGQRRRYPGRDLQVVRGHPVGRGSTLRVEHDSRAMPSAGSPPVRSSGATGEHGLERPGPSRNYPTPHSAPTPHLRKVKPINCRASVRCALPQSLGLRLAARTHPPDWSTRGSDERRRLHGGPVAGRQR